MPAPPRARLILSSMPCSMTAQDQVSRQPCQDPNRLRHTLLRHGISKHTHRDRQPGIELQQAQQSAVPPEPVAQGLKICHGDPPVMPWIPAPHVGVRKGRPCLGSQTGSAMIG